ncbi:DUF1990 family protein [Nocardia sp. NPDC055321]
MNRRETGARQGFPAEPSYPNVGATAPAAERWTDPGAGFRRFERTVPLGRGDALWDSASEALMHWEVKQRSGFRVTPLSTTELRATLDADYRITATIGPIKIHEPARVVAVVDTPTRRGFAYGTLPGHPVSGEEAFIVHRTPDDTVHLTLRSLTRPAPTTPWRPLFPILLVPQRLYRRRYLRSLLPGSPVG